MDDLDTDCKRALREISGEINRNFSVEKTEMGCMIHTPFHDPDGDPVSILIEERDGKVALSDMGESVSYLFLHGMDLKPNSKPKHFFDTSLRKLSIKFIDGELVLPTDRDGLADALLQMIEGILSVKHLTYTSRTRKHTVFKDDVIEWLDSINANYSQMRSYEGISGKRFMFDFEIRRAQKEQVLMYALHSETPTYAKVLVNNAIVSFLEVKDVGIIFESICLLDDTTEEDPWEGQLGLLRKRVDRVAFWEEREEIEQELLA